MANPEKSLKRKAPEPADDDDDDDEEEEDEEDEDDDGDDDGDDDDDDDEPSAKFQKTDGGKGKGIISCCPFALFACGTVWDISSALSWTLPIRFPDTEGALSAQGRSCRTRQTHTRDTGVSILTRFGTLDFCYCRLASCWWL